MGSIHKAIEALRQEPSNSERGAAFEMVWLVDGLTARATADQA